MIHAGDEDGHMAGSQIRFVKPPSYEEAPSAMVSVSVVYDSIKSTYYDWIEPDGTYFHRFKSDYPVEATRKRLSKINKQLDDGWMHALLFASRSHVHLVQGRHRIAVLMARRIPEVLVCADWDDSGWHDIEAIRASMT